MKKFVTFMFVFIVATFGSLAFAVPTSANDTNEQNWSNLNYVDLPIVKVLDSKDAFVVYYQKKKAGNGVTVVPKKWILGNKDTPRKLKLRFMGKGKLRPLFTVIKKDGSFFRAVLSLPKNKADPVWGVVPQGTPVNGSDKDSLEELDI